MYAPQLRCGFSDGFLDFCLLGHIDTFDQYLACGKVRSEGRDLRSRLVRVQIEDTETRKAMLEEGAAGGKSEIAGAASHCKVGRWST